jgi:hypothetical protein
MRSKYCLTSGLSKFVKWRRLTCERDKILKFLVCQQYSHDRRLGNELVHVADQELSAPFGVQRPLEKPFAWVLKVGQLEWNVFELQNQVYSTYFIVHLLKLAVAMINCPLSSL